jgi:hypothetical protein
VSSPLAASYDAVPGPFVHERAGRFGMVVAISRTLVHAADSPQRRHPGDGDPYRYCGDIDVPEAEER